MMHIFYPEPLSATQVEDEDLVPPPAPAPNPPANGHDNAAAHMGTPAGIVADDRLTREQKLRMLRDWANELSKGEGLGAGDAVLLRLVLAAIADVEAQAPGASG